MKTNNDLIERQAAIELAMQYCTDDDGSCSKADRDIRELLDDLENLPSAQPESSTDIDNALALLDAIHSSGRMDYYSDYCALHDAISSISAQPEITHCAECMHWKHSDVRKNYCEVFDWMNKAEDFCSFAERRTDE